VREQEEKMKDVLSAMEYFRLQEMEASVSAIQLVSIKMFL